MDLSGDIPKISHESIGKCEVGVLAALASNSVIVSGGSTLFFRFEERLQKEMEVLIGSNVTNNAHKDMTYLKDKYTKREQFKDTGLAIVRQKCVVEFQCRQFYNYS